MKRVFHVFALLWLLGVPIGARAQINQGVVTISVTNVAANITVDRDCNYVVVRENAATPTAVFDITLSGSATAHHYAAGTQYIFKAHSGPGGGPFKSGTVIGTIVATTSGPFSFTADESYGDPSLAARNGTGTGGAPTGTAGGDLNGNYPNPGVGKINGVSMAGLPTGIVKNTTSTGAPSIAVATDITGLFSTCSGTQYLGADGACHTASAGDTTAKYLIGAPDGTLTNAAVWPTLFTSPDIPPSSRNAMDDEFDGASLNSTNNIWTWTNQSTSTETQSNGFAVITSQTNGSSHVARFIGQTLPSAPYGFTSKFTFNEGQTNFGFGGIILFEVATSKYLVWGYAYNGGSILSLVSNAGTQLVTAGVAAYPQGYFRVSRASTTLTFWFSPDGVTWNNIFSEAITAHFTTAPDTIGLGNDSYSQVCILDVDYFRRTQ